MRSSYAKRDVRTVKRSFEATFRSLGVPEAIRTDNDPPCSTLALVVCLSFGKVGEQGGDQLVGATDEAACGD